MLDATHDADYFAQPRHLAGRPSSSAGVVHPDPLPDRIFARPELARGFGVDYRNRWPIGIIVFSESATGNHRVADCLEKVRTNPGAVDDRQMRRIVWAVF